MSPPSVAVAMSGGIDSLVAAHLLQQAGHRIFGLHFLTGYEGRRRGPRIDRRRARSRMQPIAERLGIDIDIIDVGSAFSSAVVAYFTRAYRAGQTPNPCLRCNPQIKFGVVMDTARRLGARYLATGHYARIVWPPDGGPPRLRKGLDPLKDQAYFLAFMNQAQLTGALFPLGGMTKAAVRHLAAQERLRAAADTESQDICFVRRGAYADFLLEQPGFAAQPGPIEDTSGRVIGRHDGLHRFTVGQRRGINCPGPEPYYVIRLDTTRHCLIVGPKAALYRSGCRVRGINWIGAPPSGPLRCSVRLRYRHAPVACDVFPEPDGGAGLRFDCPQAAVTPGQGAVFYRADEVLGGGWICPPDSP